MAKKKGLSDIAFQRLLNKTANACARFHNLLCAARIEYERRYGCMPEQIDDFMWREAFEEVGYLVSVKDVEVFSKYRKERDIFGHVEKQER